MATTHTLLTSGGSTDNVATYSTASVTPTAGKLYVFVALVSGTNPAPDFTISGLGLTWEMATGTAFVARGMKTYVAKGTPAAGSVTITSVGVAYTGAAWALLEVGGADLTGANALAAIQQVKQARGTTTAGPPLALPFDTAVIAGNGAIAGVAISLAEAITAGTGWTAAGATVTVTGPTSALLPMTATAAPQNIAANWTTAETAIVNAIEIKAATGGADTTAPTIPSGVSALADSPNQITISWNASTDAVGVASYRVRRGGVDLAGATAVVGTSYVDTTVLPGTAYTYTVSAVDAAGNRSAESNAAGETTPTVSKTFKLGTTLIIRAYQGSTAVGRIYLGSNLYEFDTTPPAAPPPAGGSSSAGILLSATEIAALPTTGAGWDAIAARVAAPYGGMYKIGVRDDSNKDVLAHALAGARLANNTYKTFVRDKISAMMAAGRDNADVLATLRNLQAYIISADLIDLSTFDSALDASFRTWLAAEIRHDYAGGGGGGSVISTHNKKANNFATHAGACRLAAALYLNDTAEYNAARNVWYGWITGDPAYIPSTRTWSSTNWHFNPAQKRGINEAGATVDGRRFDGVIPEDQERAGEYVAGTWPPTFTNYVHGAMDGASLSFWIMARKGETCWAWGTNAMKRQMDWKYEVGDLPYSGFRWQLRVIEKAYGVTYAGHEPTAASTNFAYADWWAQ